MRFLRAVVEQVVKLFVTDWIQTAGIALILVIGLLAARQMRSLPTGFAIAVLLGLHLVYTTASEARRRRGHAPRSKLRMGRKLKPEEIDGR